MDALFLAWSVLLVAIFTSVLSGGEIVDVRLVNGPSSYEGTVEYTTDNVTWQTMCGVYFAFDDARVICEHIGANGTNKAIIDSPFGGELGQTTTNLYCQTGDTAISECQLFPITSCMKRVIGAAICYDDTYLGCHKDNSSDRVLPGDPLIEDSTMTIDRCITHCRESTTADYVYAGVENGEECFCGVAGEDYSRLGAAVNMVNGDGNCQSQCAGDDYSSCGGIGHIAVFQIPERSQPVTSPRTTIVTTEDADTSSVLTSNTIRVGSTTTDDTHLSSTTPTITKSVGNTSNLVLTSNTIVVESTTTDDKPLSSNTPTVTRQAGNTSKLDHTSNKLEAGSTTPNDTTLYSTTDTVTRPVGNTSNLDVAAGAGGGVAVIVIVSVVIIVIVVLYKRRHGKAARKAPLPDLPLDKFDANNYDEILMESSLGKGIPSPRHPYEDCANYAVVNKEPQLNMGLAKDQEDLSALYAVSTKHRPEPEGANLGDLYAMPDKRKKSHVMRNGALKAMEPSTQESTPPGMDALYAMPDKKKEVTDDNDEDCTEMVENPIYT